MQGFFNIPATMPRFSNDNNDVDYVWRAIWVKQSYQWVHIMLFKAVASQNFGSINESSGNTGD